MFEESLAITLGYLTLLLVIAIFASCRSFISILTRSGFKDPMQLGWYRRFYKFHSFFWAAFLTVFIVHVITALIHTGLPAFGDPDALTHLFILIPGIIALFLFLALALSCRISPAIIKKSTGKNALDDAGYKNFYKNHSMYWGMFFLFAAVHIILAFIHTGFIPL
jgi:hypothetical protein